MGTQLKAFFAEQTNSLRVFRDEHALQLDALKGHAFKHVADSAAELRQQKSELASTSLGVWSTGK